MISTPASLPTYTGKRVSISKRKPPPAPTPPESADIRYPPFDLEDPFASLVDLRRRTCSFNCNVDQHATGKACVAQPTSTAPSDLPHLSSKAFPSGLGRRYTLDVALPGPVYPFNAVPDAIPAGSAGLPVPGSELGAKATDRQEALKSLTKRSTANRPDADSNRSRNPSESVQKAGSDHDCDQHHRRYSHIADFFRDASAVQPTKRHYIPRKSMSLNYMYTPSLTPDLSQSSSENVSSTSLLMDPVMSMAQTPRSASFMDKSGSFYGARSPSSSTTSLIKKLIPKRSVGSLSSIRLRKRELEVYGKDLPDLPMMLTGSPAQSIPFPRASAPPSISDISMSSARGVSSDPFRYVSLAAQDDEGYETAPEYRASVLNADLDAGLFPQRKNRLFSFSSRSLLRSRVDLHEAKKVPQVQAMNYPFDEYALPTPEQLQEAASLLVVAESGVRIRFGELWKQEQIVVIFIRHFRFSACQDYVRSIASEVDVDALEKAGLKIVVIGLGPHSLIAPYKQITGACFPIYTDPTLALHRALGMSLKTTDPGPDSERGHYITSGNSGIGMLRRTFANAVSRRLVLPLFERGGDGAQLGGEFVLGPGATCAFGHRMRHTRGHAPILDVVTASGVQTPSLRRAHRMILQRQEQELAVQDISMADEDAWMAQRRRSLARLKRKRQNRRAGRVDAAAAIIHVGEALDVKKGRFSIVEEDDEEEEEMYVSASETEPRRYDLRIDIQRQRH